MAPKLCRRAGGGAGAMGVLSHGPSPIVGGGRSRERALRVVRFERPAEKTGLVIGSHLQSHGAARADLVRG
jgi:hypothetical protein